MIILIRFFYRVNMDFANSSQHCLLVILENFKKSVDDRNKFEALLTDLSKAFDCIDHKLLIANLFCFCYRVSPSALNLIHSYLSNRTQRIKINNCFSRRSSIEYGIPQGSVLGPLLFAIDLTDLFYKCEDSNIANYADKGCNIGITIIRC